MIRYNNDNIVLISVIINYLLTVKGNMLIVKYVKLEIMETYHREREYNFEDLDNL